MEETKQPIIEIDPRGDVILELTWPDGKIGLLVSSKAMSLASTVFDTLFNSSFNEGLQRQTASKKLIIPLPQDDAEAFTIVCQVVHHRADEVSQDLTADCLVDIAIICDKYECVKAISPASATWFQALDPISFVASENHKLLHAAYVLDAPHAFSRISWEILLNHRGPYKDLAHIDNHGLLIRDMTAEFEARAATLSTELVKAVEEPINAALSGSASTTCCTSAPDEAMLYLRGLVSKGVFPVALAITRVGLYSVVQNLSTLTEPKRKLCNNRFWCENCSGPPLSYTKGAWEWSNEVMSTKRGICLDCVRTGRESYRRKQCRIKHAEWLEPMPW
ncbi:hypothetical protein MMC27_002246 [Xylographa pallens]|nr:hypothetical protein [Xylographa pallens]